MAKGRNKKEYLEQLKNIFPDLEVISEYTNKRTPILVKDAYGVCRAFPMGLLKGYKPTINIAIDKNSYFENKAKEIHGNKYDYSLVNYKNSTTKIKIISKYGVFEQLPYAHLGGQGCRIKWKVKSGENAIGWSHTNWEKAGQKSKNFTGFKVYFLECWDSDTNEKFYKIGKTFKDVDKRFNYKSYLPYDYKVLATIDGTCAKEICKIESYYKHQNKDVKYIPKKSFGGMYECFSTLTNY